MNQTKSVFEFERAGNVLVVIPTGSLMEFRDSDIRDAYNDTYRILSEPDVMHLLVDFTRLTYFGSTFVGMLIRLAKKARLGGGEAVLCNLSDNMKDMMKTLMLLENTKTDFFWVPFPSRDAALASLSAAPEAADPEPETGSEPSMPDNAGSPPEAGGGWARFVK